MGRREAPVPDGPLKEFAVALRELRTNAPGAPTYRELARRAHYSASVLSVAAAGRRLPTLNVTLAFVTACGGDADEWRERWSGLHAALQAEHPELITADDAAPQAGPPEVADDAARDPGGPETVPWRDPSAVDDMSPAIAPLTRTDPASAGPFRLLGRLGGGAMGQVYLGTSKTGRPVAVKVVRSHLAESPHFRRRFAAEVAAVRRVRSPYTPEVVDAAPDAEQPWMATTYIPGPSLGEVIDEEGPLPPDTVFRLAGGIAEALASIHAAGVLHRDLKPVNVLLDATGPKVIDFGVAQAEDATRLTETGVRVGTVPFMAPEQADGRPVTAAADVFSLGSVLAYAATGVPPFGDGTTGEVLYRIIHTDPDPAALDCGDDRLRALITACLDKDPERRPTPAQIIDACGDHAPTTDWLPAAARTRVGRSVEEFFALLGTAAARRTRRGRRAAVAAMITAVAAAAVLTAVLLYPSGSDDRARANARTSVTPSVPATPSAYVAVYQNRRLDLPNYNYYFDLQTGTVAEGDGPFSMSTNSGGDGHGAFELPDGADAYVSPSGSLTPDQCAARIAGAPASIVRFRQAPPGRVFCLRSRKTGETAVIKVIDTDDGNYAAKIAVDYYRHR
ncbi:serine/threonine-protein kinase [Actinoallomurus soli]|uniref:serine/threonine-protein kinase n=1 Tax=Actinoallomurus soli TaxID=2952535 RepID=UPI002092E945|nr:serine/threonine-protein kinase [Actinoallomurus soli]MCO5967422.1 protein kinase [Actinoallomurus soli]